MKTTIATILAALAILLVGCNSVDRWVQSTGKPVATNTIPAVIDPGTGAVIKPEEQVVSYELPPEYHKAIEDINATARTFGVPSVEIITGMITTLLAGVFAWSNNRRAKRNQTVSEILVQNVETVKKLALQYAKAAHPNDPAAVEKVNEWINKALAGAQGMAGVEEIVRSLVLKHTGNTLLEVGVDPAGTAVKPPKP
jgi:hypothetical protein